MSTEKKSKKPIPSADRDELAQVIADSLNKLNKDSDQIAYFLDGKEDTPTDFTDFISTGATMLDIAISNRPHGGIAVGRITELTGLEGSGKSLVGAQLIANTQKRGGVAVLIDTETAVNPDFFKAVGIDMNKLVYVHLSTVEDIFDAITNIIEKVRAGKDKDKLVTIIVDSVAAASTKKEMEADFGKELTSAAVGYITFSVRGVTDSEMVDLLSLDGVVMKSVAQYWSVSRVPSRKLASAFVKPVVLISHVL